MRDEVNRACYGTRISLRMDHGWERQNSARMLLPAEINFFRKTDFLFYGNKMDNIYIVEYLFLLSSLVLLACQFGILGHSVCFKGKIRIVSGLKKKSKHSSSPPFQNQPYELTGTSLA